MNTYSSKKERIQTTELFYVYKYRLKLIILVGSVISQIFIVLFDIFPLSPFIGQQISINSADCFINIPRDRYRFTNSLNWNLLTRHQLLRNINRQNKRSPAVRNAFESRLACVDLFSYFCYSNVEFYSILKNCYPGKFRFTVLFRFDSVLRANGNRAERMFIHQVSFFFLPREPISISEVISVNVWVSFH